VDHQAQRHRLAAELREPVHAWRLYPVVQARQARRGVQFMVAVTLIADLGDLSPVEHPRQLMSSLDLIRRA
jgi:hypothetical protein